jgi:transcriptional regulator with XRE-family HTH domain
MATDHTGQRHPRREQLAAELRRLRELAGLSGRDLAKLIDVSQSKVSRIESGNTIPSLPEVTRWSKAVAAPAERREWLAALTESVFTEVHGWPAALEERGHIQDEVEERETRAELVRTFQPSVVPGLLQTAEYARRVLAMAEVPCAVDDLAAALAGRLQRQLALYEEDKRFEFLITEAALRWRPGSAKALIAQLDRVASLSTLENVSVGIIPLSTKATVPMSHGFVIYNHNDGGPDTVVEVETIHANLIVNNDDHVRLYHGRWSLLNQMAIFDDAARTLLSAISDEIRAMGAAIATPIDPQGAINQGG